MNQVSIWSCSHCVRTQDLSSPVPSPVDPTIKGQDQGSVFIVITNDGHFRDTPEVMCKRKLVIFDPSIMYPFSFESLQTSDRYQCVDYSSSWSSSSVQELDK